MNRTSTQNAESSQAAKAAIEKISLIQPPLPFFLRVLVSFLLVSSAVKLGQVGIQYYEGTVLGRDEFWNLLIGSFYLLLVPQILLRSLVARFVLTLLFLIQISGVFYASVILALPWQELNSLERLQQFSQITFFTIAVILLNKRPVIDHLRY